MTENIMTFCIFQPSWLPAALQLLARFFRGSLQQVAGAWVDRAYALAHSHRRDDESCLA